jgi:hypothetical protein
MRVARSAAWAASEFTITCVYIEERRAPSNDRSEAHQLAMHTLDQYHGIIVACQYFPPPELTRSASLANLKA